MWFCGIYWDSQLKSNDDLSSVSQHAHLQIDVRRMNHHWIICQCLGERCFLSYVFSVSSMQVCTSKKTYNNLHQKFETGCTQPERKNKLSNQVLE